MNVTAICNMALAKIGEEPIDSYENDNTKAALTCRRFFDFALKTLIRETDWQFAKATRQLEAYPKTDWDNAVLKMPSEFAYTYYYPADCLRIRKIGEIRDGKVSWLSESEGFFYEVATLDEKTVIACNVSNACIQYNYDLTDLSSAPVDFIDALATQLAYRISYALTGQGELMQAMLNLYERDLGRALATNRSEEKDKPIRNEFVETRCSWD